MVNGDAQPVNRPADAGTRSLLVAPWPLHRSTATNAQRLALLAGAATGILQSGGCIVFIADYRPDRGDYTTLVDAATTAGLRYLQHIVAIGADIDGVQLTYHGTERDLDEPDSTRHHRIHTDLLVFSTPTMSRTDG
jgi:hypothetical protein